MIVPKVAHPWFDEVQRGALAQARFLEGQLGSQITVEYRPPAMASVELQNTMLAEVAGTNPAGIAVDPLVDISGLPAVTAARDQGVAVVVFDSPSSDPAFPSVGTDFAEQGAIAARRLVDLIGGRGEVAVMQGFPSAPNHRQRYLAELDVLRQHPGITVVDGGADNDDIPTAREQAEACLASHPHLRGYLCCDASGPIGIAAAIKDSGKVGRVTAVGMDGIEPILEAIKDGVLDSSAASIPGLQGSMSLLMLWQASEGLRIPQRIDTGIDLITAENVDSFLAAYHRT